MSRDSTSSRATTPPPPSNPKSTNRRKDDQGESLEGFDENEWSGGSAALKPELINIKKEINKVSVFKAKNRSAIRRDGNRVPSDPTQKPSSENLTKSEFEPPFNTQLPVASPYNVGDKADLIGKMVAGIVRMYLDCKSAENVQVEVRLVDTTGKKEPTAIQIGNNSASGSQNATVPVRLEDDQRGGRIIGFEPA